jgi:GTP-sensing pleiotropic transcriptional regulator CodY
LKSLGRAPSGEQHEQFKEQISRLMGGVIEVLSVKDKKSFLGTLIKNAYRDEVSKRYVIIFNEKTLQLFQVGYSLIDWEYRQALGKNNLAKWLHAFYSTHAGAYEYKVETLNTLCGSTTKRLGDFRKSLINALQKLKDIGAIQSWSIGEFSDLVNVVTYPTNTQKKYIYKSKRAVKSQSKAGLI